MKIQGGSKLKCNCGAIVGEFVIDWETDKPIPADSFHPSKEQILKIEAFTRDAGKYGCEKCNFQAISMTNDGWRLTPNVKISRS